MTSLLTIILILFSMIPLTVSLNILIWATTIGRSHITFMGGLADIIHQDGHNVTILILKNDPDVNITGSKYVNRVIRFESPLIESYEWSYFNFKQSDIFYTKTIDMGDFFKMQSVNSRICQSLLDDSNLLNVLKESNFDVAVVEFFHFCPAGILELIGVKKVILATALGMTHAHYELLNLEVPLSYVPVQMTHLGSKMSFCDRLYNVAFYYASKFCYNYILWQDQWIFWARFGWNFPNLEKLYKRKVDFVFTNTNEFTESTRPTLQMVKYIGGSTTPVPKLLSKDFETILSRPKSRGTIVFSLGSLLKPEEMPEFMKSAFLEGFKEFPEYTFIWKSSNSSQIYPNIYYREWLPQVDLLADKRLRVFITHGGMNSVQESLYFGVPLITIPIFADQDSNSVVAQERGYSYNLDKFSVTKNDVVQALHSVLDSNDKESSYTKMAKQASRILQRRRKLIREEISNLVYLSGTSSSLSHLRIDTDHLNSFEYYNLDIYIFIIAIIFSISYIFRKISSSKYLYFRVQLRSHCDDYYKKKKHI